MEQSAESASIIWKYSNARADNPGKHGGSMQSGAINYGNHDSLRASLIRGNWVFKRKNN